jgi:hypothetical protein
MEKPYAQPEVLYRTRFKALETFETCRIGWIKKLDREHKTVWVDYEHNPAQRPIVAKLVNAWISFAELESALQRQAKVQIGFENGHPLKPVIRDIFYSLEERLQPEEIPTTERVVRIEAEEIILSAQKQIVIESGATQTVYDAKTGTFTVKAKTIETTADKSHRIKGGAVLIN